MHLTGLFSAVVALGLVTLSSCKPDPESLGDLYGRDPRLFSAVLKGVIGGARAGSALQNREALDKLLNDLYKRDPYIVFDVINEVAQNHNSNSASGIVKPATGLRRRKYRYSKEAKTRPEFGPLDLPPGNIAMDSNYLNSGHNRRSIISNSGLPSTVQQNLPGSSFPNLFYRVPSHSHLIKLGKRVTKHTVNNPEDPNIHIGKREAFIEPESGLYDRDRAEMDLYERDPKFMAPTSGIVAQMSLLVSNLNSQDGLDDQDILDDEDILDDDEDILDDWDILDDQDALYEQDEVL